MSEYDCRNKCVFSFFQNTDSNEADVMSSGRLFQSFGPAEANERSPTVTRRDGRTSSWLQVADRRRRRDGKSATRRRRSDRYWGAVPCRARYTRTASLKLIRSESRSQWKCMQEPMELARLDAEKDDQDLPCDAVTEWEDFQEDFLLLSPPQSSS